MFCKFMQRSALLFSIYTNCRRGAHLHFALRCIIFVIAKREPPQGSRFFVHKNGIFSAQKWDFFGGAQEKLGVYEEKFLKA